MRGSPRGVRPARRRTITAQNSHAGRSGKTAALRRLGCARREVSIDPCLILLRLLLVVCGTFLGGFGGFFDRHIMELFGIKDFATFQALDEFTVFVPGDDSYPGVFAGGRHGLYELKLDALPADCSGLSMNFK